MDNNLIERLRGINRNYDLARGIYCDIREAADRIEALEAAIVQAREALEEAAGRMLWAARRLPPSHSPTVEKWADELSQALSALDKQ